MLFITQSLLSTSSTFFQNLDEKFPAWTSGATFGFKNAQWYKLFGLLLICWILVRILRFFASRLIQRFLTRYEIFGLSKKMEKKITFPAGMIFFSLLMTLVFPLLKFPPAWTELIHRLLKISGTVGIILLAYFLIDLFSLYFDSIARKSESKFDDILVPLLKKCTKTFVIAIGVIMIGDSLNFDMKSLIAGLGIGGLAFALAAKDSIANLFGSLTVILDRPFRIGDFVKISSDVEGTVEQVGLRSTRIRTPYDSVISVPNGNLTNISIDNFGFRNYRRFNTNIGVTYDTPPEKIEAFCEGIRQIIVRHPHTRKDNFNVYLNSMGDFSLNIILQVFWKVPDISNEMAERHRLLIDIIRLAQSLKVEFAFPTSSLYLYQAEQAKHEAAGNNFHDLGAQAGQKVADAPISFLGPRSKAGPQGDLPLS